MPNCPPHPPIGATGDTTDSTAKTFLAILGVLGTAGTVIGILINSTKVGTVPVLGITGEGVGSIALSAVAAAAAVVLYAFTCWYDRCSPFPRPG